MQQGSELRDAGIQQAMDSADSAAPYNWSDKAYAGAVKYLQAVGCGHEFQAEDMRKWLYDNKLISAPPSLRAWGGVVVRLRNEKLIKCIGTRPVINPKAHCANASLWVVM